MYDISFWRGTPDEPRHRLGREVHYPPVIDVLDPYILLVHQGMVESLFLEDMKKRGVEVRRNTAFESYSACDIKGGNGPLQINCRTNVTQDRRIILAQYLVGCELLSPWPRERRSHRADRRAQATALTRKCARASRRRGRWASRSRRCGVSWTASS